MHIVLAILIYCVAARALVTGRLLSRNRRGGYDRDEQPFFYWHGVISIASFATLFLLRAAMWVMPIWFALMGVAWLVVAKIERRASGQDENDEYNAWRQNAPRWARILVNVTSGVGLIGVVTLIACVLARSWWPTSVEWPIGHADGVITTLNGFHVVPVAMRIQVYDPSWHFVRAWHVDDENIHLVPARLPDRFEIYRPKGRRTDTSGEHSIWTLNGEIVWTGDYSIRPAEYDAIMKRATSVDRPTPIWWPNATPTCIIVAVAVWAICVIVFNVTYLSQRRKISRVLQQTETLQQSA